jgi:glyoxylase-like metal-dependent hydrolase (beta-lactamase superfamily II)
MKINRLVFNPYEVNTYIIEATDRQCIIVDPACGSHDEQAYLENYITDNGLHPAWIINTHGHFDHVIGNAFVSCKWNVQTIAHRDDLKMMQTAYRQGEIFGYQVEQPPIPSMMADGGTKLVLDDIVIDILHVPGHSPGSIVLYLQQNQIVIVGDVLFRGSIGRSDLPGSNPALLLSGIEQKLMTLPADTVVYPGHGPATSIEREKLRNPFLNGKYCI